MALETHLQDPTEIYIFNSYAREGEHSGPLNPWVCMSKHGAIYTHSWKLGRHCNLRWEGRCYTGHAESLCMLLFWVGRPGV